MRRPVRPTGELITFRDLPGGRFYHGPFTHRTTGPLVRRIGDDLELLRANLSRFDHRDVAGLPADLAVSIQAIGCVAVTLLYHRGDDEAPPSAELLFDACIGHIYQTEDVAVLSSRLCTVLSAERYCDQSR